MKRDPEIVIGSVLCILIFVLVVLVTILSNNLEKTTKFLESEVCSYSCDKQNNGWPDSAKLVGRNEKGQALCECLYKR